MSHYYRLLVTGVLGLLLASARLFAAAAPFAAEQQLRRDTESALALLKPAIDQASARWRADLLGQVKSRSGQPVPEATLFAEIRRATEATGGAGPTIETLWQDLQGNRVDARGFGDRLDEIFSEAVITSWDVYLSEAKYRLGLAQVALDAEAAPLRLQWTRTSAEIGARAGLTESQRLLALADAADAIKVREQQSLTAGQAALDSIARQLAAGRQTLYDLVMTRANAAQQARRPGAPQRLTELVTAHFESSGPGAAGVGSTLDSFLASANLSFSPIVARGQPANPGLAERIKPLLATRLAVEPVVLLQGPRPPPPPSVGYVTVLERGTDPTTGAPTRVLGILGKGLITSGSPAVSGETDRAYQVIATRGGLLGVAAAEANAGLWLTLGNRATAGLTPQDETMAKLLDAVLVRVRLPTGLLPGLESFRVAGAEAIWPLDAPTTHATLSFIRQMPWDPLVTDFDRPQELFLQSEFAVQVETEHPLRVPSLEIALIGPEDTIVIEDASGRRQTRLIATPLLQAPLMVRTAPIHLYPTGQVVPVARRTPGHFYLWLKHQDTLIATIVGRPFDDGGAATTVDSAAILGTPGNIPTVDGKGMLFLEAVRDAAIIHTVDMPTNPDLESQPIVDKITHTYLAQWRQEVIPFSLADHAAMLALKRAFIAMAGRVLANHREVLSTPQRIQAYVPEMTRIMMRGAHMVSDMGTNKVFPLGYDGEIRIVTEKGLNANGRDFARGRSMAPLVKAFLEGPFGIYDDPHEAAVFRLAATRKALEIQVEGLEKAIAYARDCDDDKVEELLELVGAGFGPVVDEITPRLVRSEADPVTGSTRWVPDRTARLAVRQVADTLQQHLTAKSAAKHDTDAVLALLTVTGLGLAEGAGAKIVLAIASAASVGVAGLDIYNLELSRSESKFAANAVEIIGEDRLVSNAFTLDLRATPYLTLAMSVIGLKLDFSDAARAIQLSTARRATEQAMGRIAEQGFFTLARLPLKERALASALMDEATALRAAGKPLSPAQQTAVRAADRIESQLTDYHPWGGGRPFDPNPALHPVADDFRSAVTEVENDFRSAVTEVEPRTGVGNAPAVDGGTPATAGSGSLRPPAPGSASRYMPVSEIHPNMPKPGHEIVDPATGTLYRVGQPYGAGAYATTYDLLDSSGRPTGRVVKYLRHPFDDEPILLARMHNPGEATAVPWDESPLHEVVDRIMEGQALLERAKIPRLRIGTMEEGLAASGRNGFPPFMVQDVIPPNAVRVTKSAELNAGQRAAVATLYNRLAEANLVWVDGHLGNIYFTQVGNAWEAGILDPDMIVRFDQPIASEFLQGRIGQIFALPNRYHMASIEAPVQLQLKYAPDIAQRVAGNSREFMARMLEFKGLVKFEKLSAAEAAARGVKNAFKGALNPDEVGPSLGRLAEYLKAR